MDKELIRTLLPEEPRPGLLSWTKRHCGDELGHDYMVWHPKKVPVYDIGEAMTDNDWKPKRYERVADCTCKACGANFATELAGNLLRFWIDDCGEWWDLDPRGQCPYEDEESYANGYDVEIESGDNVQCPLCMSELVTIQAKDLRGGRRKQIMVISIEVIQGYAAVVYWLVRREIYDTWNRYSVHPRDAYVLDENGTIHRYTHTIGGGLTTETNDECWRLTKNKRDSLDMVYHDWGSVSNKKKGGLFYDEDTPDLDGTTAEKTGLQEFVGYDGTYSVEYLKLWKRFPSLENLVITGWGRLVDQIAAMSFGGYDAKTEMAKVIDISKSKPHEILGMSKSDFRTIRKNNWQWNFEAQVLFNQFRESGFTSALQFHTYLLAFKDDGIRALLDLNRLYGDRDIEKIKRYLEKQNMRPSEAGILLDTRNAAKALAGERPLSQEELWPRNLQDAHDRLTRARILQIDQEKAKKYQMDFDAVISKFEDLQWTDGDLCIVIPKSYVDLVQEGNVLRHCVGGYSEDHISGRHTIFFVRHYRRPERSYYTLDINMLDRPYRQQLHGYGNERHGINKQYRHTIPQKVLEFCDRWEREVLMPWYRDNQKEGKTA